MGGRRAVALILGLVALFTVAVVGFAFTQQWRQSERLVAAGLRSPRGMAWIGEDLLVVAEAGLADAAGRGDRSTRQIATGRLSWTSAIGNSRGTMVDGLPGEYIGLLDEVIGPAAVGLAPDGRLYTLTGQCQAPLCSALLARQPDGQLTTVADLRAFARAHPAVSGAAPNDESNPWGVAVASDGVVYVTDAAANSLLRIDPRVSPASIAVHARLGENPVPTGIALGPDGALYVALFGPLPHPAGAGSIVRVDDAGSVTSVVAGLTMPVGVGFEPDGHLLVLELADGYDPATGYRAGSGRLLRIGRADSNDRRTLSSGLDFPTALVVAPDGRVFVSNSGAFGRGASGQGEVLQIRRVGPPPKRRVF